MPDYCEVVESEHGYEDARRNTDGEPRGKEASTRKDSSNFLMVSSRPASTSLTSNLQNFDKLAQLPLFDQIREWCIA